MSTTVAADLRAAADVLRRDGWTQGDAHDASGHCAVGARILRATIGQRFIADWNDARGRTAEQVIAAFEAAADAAEATS